LVHLSYAAQCLEYPFCAPMASTSKACLCHHHFPHQGEILDAAPLGAEVAADSEWKLCTALAYIRPRLRSWGTTRTDAALDFVNI